ncbi:MAG: response regulator [Chitinophagaceae bacterium]|nr:response regulator [Chitinophagaceae bacterium]
MAKILVADDEADLEVLIKQKFRRQIREAQFEFLFALNGLEALERLKQNPDIDMVLTDINMPEMDGLTLLQKIHEVNPILQAVIVSAYGDMDNIRTAMNRGAFDFITKPVNFEDLEITMNKTLEHVKQLRTTLQAIKENNILKMYVDENVLRFMNREEFGSNLVKSETIEATAVFIDICGFTSISETRPADEVVNLLNTIFDIIVKEIILQDGQIDKFIGDAVLAVFKGEYSLDRAIEACLSVRSKVDKMDLQVNDYKVKVSIGINFGEMVSGNIGSVNLKRLDYTVIGDAVNVAQRLQDIAAPGQVLITQDCFLKIKEAFNCQPIGERQLKNKALPVMVFEVLE